jgi:transcriptional regulator with XRE-family HTH domain
VFQPRLCSAIRADGRSVKHLAGAIGIGKSTLFRALRGDASTSLRFGAVVALADVLGVSLDELAGREPPFAARAVAAPAPSRIAPMSAPDNPYQRAAFAISCSQDALVELRRALALCDLSQVRERARELGRELAEARLQLNRLRASECPTTST